MADRPAAELLSEFNAEVATLGDWETLTARQLRSAWETLAVGQLEFALEHLARSDSALTKVQEYANRCAILRVEPTTSGLRAALRASQDGQT